MLLSRRSKKKNQEYLKKNRKAFSLSTVIVRFEGNTPITTPAPHQAYVQSPVPQATRAHRHISQPGAALREEGSPLWEEGRRSPSPWHFWQHVCWPILQSRTLRPRASDPSPLPGSFPQGHSFNKCSSILSAPSCKLRRGAGSRVGPDPQTQRGQGFNQFFRLLCWALLSSPTATHKFLPGLVHWHRGRPRPLCFRHSTGFEVTHTYTEQLCRGR